MVSPRLVGRDVELALLVETVTEPPAVAVVEGEAGIGKTRLIGELRSRLVETGPHVVVGQSRRVREPFPLGLLLEALRTVGTDLDAARSTPAMGALRPLLPELADVLPPRPEPLDDRLAERHRVFRGLRDALESLGPAILVLEDMHWADGQTVDFLHYLLSDPPPTLAVLLTYRGEEATADVRGLTARLPEPLNVARIELGPLDATETGALVAAILDAEEVSDEFAGYLCDRASGVPFAVEQLLALLRERGNLVPHGGRWARKALDELGVPIGIRDTVLERVDRLGKDARSALEAAAVLQTPVPVSALVATSDLPDSRVRSGLDEALGSGLLDEHANRIGFRHVLSAQAVYEGIPLPRRQALHGRAADALDGLRPVPLGQQAHHLRMAERHVEWALAAERAAEQALELGDEDEAVRLLEDVVQQESTLAPEVRGRIAATYGHAALHASRAEGYDVLSALLEQEHEMPIGLRGEVRFWLAMLMYVTRTDLSRQHELFAQAVDDLVSRPDLQAWALVNLGLPMVPDVPLSEHLDWLRRAEDVLGQVNDRVFEVHLRGKIGMVLTAVGDPAWRQHAARVRELTSDMPTGRLELTAYRDLAADACYAGHHQVAGELLQVGLACAESFASPRPRLIMQATLAFHAYCTGSWDGLRQQLPRLLDQLRENMPSHCVDGLLAAAGLAAADGDVDQARRWFDEIDREVDALGNAVDALPIATAAKVRHALALGDVQGAVAAVDDLTYWLDAKPIWVPATRALPAAVQALTAAGRTEDAATLVDRAEQELAGLDAPLALAALPHARGFLLADEGRWPDVGSRFLTAAEHYDRLQAPYEAAQAREQAALALLALDDPRAGDELRTAEIAYQNLSARMDLDRTHEIARRHGIALPARYRGGRRGYGDDLSPRQRRVAELAAQGRTNQEIAGELHVSVSTVKHHMTAVMRKLEVRSRAALAHRMAVDQSVSSEISGTFGRW